MILTQGEMKFKILDFGHAQPLRDPDNFNHQLAKKDILDVGSSVQ